MAGTDRLTHIDQHGAAHMVDVGGKAVTRRTAVATGQLSMNAAARAAALEGSGPKGDVMAAMRIAGIMAAKRTADLIPLCHPLPLSSVNIGIEASDKGLTVTATATTDAQTGVEMEALTAVSVALLTGYDMVKALDKGCIISGVRLLSKSGGKSGDWLAADHTG